MSTKSYSPRLADKYKKDVVPALVKKFSYGSVMQAPRLEKICLNRGVNGAVSDKKMVDIAMKSDRLMNALFAALNPEQMKSVMRAQIPVPLASRAWLFSGSDSQG